MNRIIVCVLLSLFGSAMLSAQVKLLPIFSDNMVLQQRVKAPIWGETLPNKTVEIIISWNKKKYTALADEKGKWIVKVDTPSAGGPYTITISDGKPVMLSNVLIGEVWICSGQSNMEMQVEGWGKINNYQQEIADAQKYPNIRLMQIKKTISTLPVTDFDATNDGWQICSSQTIGDFSAVGYFFGRDLHKYRDVPIGLIDTTWGGTIIETWMSAEALETMPALKSEVEAIKQLPVTKEGREKVYNQALENWGRAIEEKDRGFVDGKAIWAGVDYDTNEWKTMKVPGIMQEQELKGFNGIVWFRKEINIPVDWENQDLTLRVGQVDDNDFTYFNGVEVGHTEGWLSPRSYTIPKELVKRGKAVISVRVIDTGGTGGIYGPSENVFIQKSETERIELAGLWNYKIAMTMKEVPAMPRNSTSDPNTPTYLFNAMLNPLVPYAIKGVIWYQGESNEGYYDLYTEDLVDFVEMMRKIWGENMPFYSVQITSHNDTGGTWPNIARLRHAQTASLDLIDNYYLICSMDYGSNALDTDWAHPKNKKHVGDRLAYIALSKIYQPEKYTLENYGSPAVAKVDVKDGYAYVYFKYVGDGLQTCDGSKEVMGFYSKDALSDLQAEIVSKNCVKVILEDRLGNSITGKDFTFVYGNSAMSDQTSCNLQNSNGIGALAFSYKYKTDK